MNENTGMQQDERRRFGDKNGAVDPGFRNPQAFLRRNIQQNDLKYHTWGAHVERMAMQQQTIEKKRDFQQSLQETTCLLSLYLHENSICNTFACSAVSIVSVLGWLLGVGMKIQRIVDVGLVNSGIVAMSTGLWCQKKRFDLRLKKSKHSERFDFLGQIRGKVKLLERLFL